MKTEIHRNIRKLSEEDKRNVRETIADRLAAGEVTLGEAVRLMRLAVGMTQANYAKMVGVDIRVLIAVEKGQGNPRFDSLEKIAKPYGLAVSPVNLLLEVSNSGADGRFILNYFSLLFQYAM